MVTAVRTTVIEKSHDDYYGLVVFKVNGKEYATGTVAEAELSARELAREYLDLINTGLVLKHSCLPPEAAPLVRYVQDGVQGGGDEANLLIRLFERSGSDATLIKVPSRVFACWLEALSYAA